MGLFFILENIIISENTDKNQIYIYFLPNKPNENHNVIPLFEKYTHFDHEIQ